MPQRISSSLGLGVLAGYGAVLFRALIGFVHNLMFLGTVSPVYDANVFTPPSPWGFLIIFVPVIGGLGVTFLVTKFAPETRGHGVPEVMDAIYYSEGRIRPVVAAIKSLASALAIGTGASVGREGPIIQIGASLGSTIGQVLPMASWQRITLVAAGAGAGIAATFNTPIGGVMFAIELMMPEVSVRTFLPVALATGTATFVARAYVGLAPAFEVPALPALTYHHAGSLVTLALYGLLGVATGLAATAFIQGLHRSEAVFERIGDPYLRHTVGMLALGIMIYLLFVSLGHYYVEGVGYATVQAVLAGSLVGFPVLLLLFACKLAATLLSLGSGSSGGIFSPSLFMGATLGAAFGALAAQIAPGLGLSPVAFAMVGMAAMVGGGTGAAMTAVTMIFEMTRDYNVIIPVIIGVAFAYGTRTLLHVDSIYTAKLTRRGHFIPASMQTNLYMLRTAIDFINVPLMRVAADADVSTLYQSARSVWPVPHVLVVDGGWMGR